jgi:hypothetical protein
MCICIYIYIVEWCFVCVCVLRISMNILIHMSVCLCVNTGRMKGIGPCDRDHLCIRALVPLVRAKASSIQAMHHPHKVTIVSNGVWAKPCKIPVSLGGMNIHKYQICSFVCPKMGSSILSAVPAWLVDHHFPYQMACVQLDFLTDPPQKKNTI